MADLQSQAIKNYTTGYKNAVGLNPNNEPGIDPAIIYGAYGSNPTEFEFNPMKNNLTRARALFENDEAFKTHAPHMAALLDEIKHVEKIRKVKELLNV